MQVRRRDITVCTAGGKKYGQLKTKQESELESINQVRAMHFVHITV